MTINHVQQTTAFNCGSAVLAMILNTDIETIETIARDPAADHGHDVKEHNDGYAQIGYLEEEISYVLFNRGIPNTVVRHLNDPVILPAHSVAQEQFKHTIPSIDGIMDWLRIEQDRMAVFGVESRKEEDQDHWILATDEMVLDPGARHPKPWSDYESDPWVVTGSIILVDMGLEHMVRAQF